MDPVRFILTAEEKNSALWKKLKLQLQQRLLECRILNDEALDEHETEQLRGQIAIIKELLTLDDESAII